MHHLPVVSATGQRLMPCHAARARQLLRQGKAIKRHDRGLVYLQLTGRTTGATQPIACGIDSGSKKEGLVVQSTKYTFLNVQADAVTWVSNAVKTRRQMRRQRRSRKTPHRPCRPNRLARQRHLPPSTRARWGLKVRIVRWLARYYPLTVIVIEDVAAPTRPGNRRWNASFSPLEVGKQWCYRELATIAAVQTVPGYVTKALREEAGVNKSHQKVSDAWNAHCVDAFVLATSAVGGPLHPTSQQMLHLVPLRFHRRQLHRLQAEKGGLRRPYGGTLSLGLKRGAWVRHPRWGLAYVGGTTNGRISLHDMQTGKRLTQNAQVEECRVLCTASWRMRAENRLKKSAPPAAKAGAPKGEQSMKQRTRRAARTSEPTPAVLAWLRLARVFAKVDRASAQHLRHWGLSVAQFDVLAQVGAAEGLSQQELAAKLLVTKGNVTQLLDRMQRDGLIVRCQEGRTNCLFLTEKGRRLFDTVVPAQEDFIAARFASLSGQEQLQLLKLLRTLDHTLG